MYESPIEIIQKDIVMKQENDIYQAILEQGIVVDKEELIKALKYDRDQYEKGFADGKAHVEANIAKQWEAFKALNCIPDIPEIVRCKDCKHWNDEFEFCSIHHLDGVGDGLFGGDAFCNDGERRTDDE